MRAASKVDTKWATKLCEQPKIHFFQAMYINKQWFSKPAVQNAAAWLAGTQTVQRDCYWKFPYFLAILSRHLVSNSLSSESYYLKAQATNESAFFRQSEQISVPTTWEMYTQARIQKIHTQSWYQLRWHSLSSLWDKSLPKWRTCAAG